MGTETESDHPGTQGKANLLLVPAALLLGLGAGAGAFYLGSRSREAGRPAPVSSPTATPAPAPAAGSAELAELRKLLAAQDARLAKLEARPEIKPEIKPEGRSGWEEALNDPATRDRIAAILAEARGPATMAPRMYPPTGFPEPVREGLLSQYRTSYAKIIEQARASMKLDDAAWRDVRPILDKHFAPLEDALKELVAGRTGAMPKINELVSPGLPETLAALQKRLTPEAWQAFETWRKAEEAAGPWGSGKGDYFLAGDDYKAYRAKRQVGMSWSSFRGMLWALYPRLGVDAQNRDKVEAVFKGHFDHLGEAFKDGNFPNDLMTEAGRAKAKQVTAATEEELGKLIGAENLQKFREWKAVPDGAGMYFGEGAPSRPVPGAVPAPAPAPARTPAPIPGPREPVLF